MAFVGEPLTHRERKILRLRRMKEQAEKAAERTERRRRNAYRIANRPREERDDEGRAECLLRGLQRDVGTFYMEALSVTGIDKELERERHSSVYGAYVGFDQPEPEVGDTKDDFNRAGTRPIPRKFLSRGHLKGMAYRLNRLNGLIGLGYPGHTIATGYKEMLVDLKRTGIYKELVKIDSELAGLPATIS